MTRFCLLLSGLLLLPGLGCHCLSPKFKQSPPPLPAMFSGTPTLDQLTSAVYRNSTMVRTMEIDEATIRVAGVAIPVKASILLERPKRLRIRGGISTITGQEIDFGSNDELFWLWRKRDENRMLAYARHDQFATSPVRRHVPLDPAWLLEAVGIIDPVAGERHSGPFTTENGKLKIETERPGLGGMCRKITIIDPVTGCILRQEMYSPQGELTAVAVTSDHLYDPATGILYARHIEIQCQGAEGMTTIDLGTPKFNISINPAEFIKPTFPGYQEIDICSPQFLQALPAAPPTSTVMYQSPPTVAPYPGQTAAPVYAQQPYAPSAATPVASATTETVIR